MKQKMAKIVHSLIRRRKIVFCFFLIIMAVALTAKDGSALSPPEWLVYDYLYSSVGKTKGVTVQEPIEVGDKWVINVVVGEQKKREALATLLREKMEGDEEGYITIRVVDSNGNIQNPVPISGTIEEKLAQLEDLVLDAFKKNSLFYKVITINPESVPLLGGVYIIFKARVVQFYADDISDYYSNQNFVAAELFKMLLRDSISDVFIKPSTQEM